MNGVLVVIAAAIFFYVLANILEKNSYDPESDMKRKQCANNLERKVYDHLRYMGLSPTVQEKIGKYRLDFAIYGRNGKKLCIEVDGYTFHNTPEAKRKDAIRDAYLKKLGWEVLRISDRQLKKNLNMCMRKIEARLYDMDLLPEEHPSMQLKLQTKEE
ncbi:endonuclease domain-containing protein [Bacillus paramycoides]|uniref:endonuclease domain-containing protein n=1 Tax=Bacillus paramycoides TaxID=2026194 RepID=UPI003D07C669